MQFQNTIAYAQYHAEGGEFTIASGQDYSKFPFEMKVVNEIEKNVFRINEVEWIIGVRQTGIYYVDFSFIAEQGDAKRYTIAPYIGTTKIGTTTAVEFYQQPDNMAYEVSATWLIGLDRGDKLSIELSGSAVPTETFYTKDIKMSIFCLQQLGIH